MTVQLYVTKTSDVVLFGLLICCLMTLESRVDGLVGGLFFSWNYEILALK